MNAPVAFQIHTVADPSRGRLPGDATILEAALKRGDSVCHPDYPNTPLTGKHIRILLETPATAHSILIGYWSGFNQGGWVPGWQEAWNNHRGDFECFDEFVGERVCRDVPDWVVVDFDATRNNLLAQGYWHDGVGRVYLGGRLPGSPSLERPRAEDD